MGHGRRVEIPGPAGRLEGLLQGTEIARPRRLALVCHPLPSGGGTMHTKVVHRAARALESGGHRVLRFNFRGVGTSEGRIDEGRGAQDDALAALGWLRAERPDLPVTLAGFSFGSYVGLRVGCADPSVDALVGIACPAGLYDFSFLARCPAAKLFVHGTADALAPLGALEATWDAIAEPKRLARIAGASHLLTEALDEVEEAIRAFARALPAVRPWD